MSTSPAAAGARPLDAIVVGAGFAGMYALWKLRQFGFTARALEAGGDVGGTWYWNRYPGARCDGESMFYSYGFSPELDQDWTWSERYAAQPEILAYARHVADRFDLRKDIDFDTRVARARFDTTSRLWHLTTERGDVYTARFCIMATGNLSTANLPNFPGIESFAGPIYHTGQWPHEAVSFAGQRVVVIGTGSSAMQSIPLIAAQARHLTVFQRTPTYAVPAWNRPLQPDEIDRVKSDYPALREKQRWTFSHNMFEPPRATADEMTPAEQEAELERRWREGGLGFTSAFSDLHFSDEANAIAADFVRRKIRAVVRDPDVAERLTPKIIIGCKRLCVVTDYYETFNRENVTLVDIGGSGIERFTPTAVVAGGTTYPADALVLATGFDAMTGTLLRIDIATSAGLSLQEKWQHGPVCYLGLMMAGLPNLFIITGPGSPSVFTNMIPTIEHHVDFAVEAMAHLRQRGLDQIDANADAEETWVRYVADVAAPSIRPSCNSWYVGANIPGKPRVFMPFMGGVPVYRQRCAEIVARGYEGFTLS